MRNLTSARWEEKKKVDGGIYTERMKYYNRNGWSIKAREMIHGEEGFENQLINREREVQKQ